MGTAHKLVESSQSRTVDDANHRDFLIVIKRYVYGSREDRASKQDIIHPKSRLLHAGAMMMEN